MIGVGCSFTNLIRVQEGNLGYYGICLGLMVEPAETILPPITAE